MKERQEVEESHKRALSWGQVKAEEWSTMMDAAEGTQEAY